jgi:phosphatidylglycerophosphate synthase
MRKISSDYDNPLDNLLISLSDYLSPLAYKYKFTPNILTTISLITFFICAIFILNSYYVLAAFMYLVSYFFDSIDGHFARKYKMVSKFGDYYDHISDLIKGILLVYILYSINSIKFFIVLPFLAIFLFLSFVHLGCQELYYDKKHESHTLDNATKLCPVKNVNDKSSILDSLKYTRYFGPGTITLLVMIIIIYYGRNGT